MVSRLADSRHQDQHQTNKGYNQQQDGEPPEGLVVDLGNEKHDDHARSGKQSLAQKIMWVAFPDS
jgi:hypothetical protein